jgi:histidinol dehydrogenase
MRILDSSDTRALARLIERDEARDPRVERTVARIVADVRKRGDRAVRHWEKRVGTLFSKGISRADLWRNPPDSRDKHDRKKSPDLFSAKKSPDPFFALRLAATHIRAVAKRQVPRPFAIEVRPGVRVEQHVQPLERVGCYVPGGRHALPSTLLMTTIPAKVAGVREVIVCCPHPTDAVLAAARVAGVTKVLAIGGAQAIAAMAYGTESIPRVDKIVGPGSAWVAAAKSLVARDCPIDMHAGPSEIVVYSPRGRADWIAADLIAQAEHDPAARAIFVTTRRSLAMAVQREVRRQLPTTGPARTALARNGGIVLAPSRPAAVALVNRIAPEHLVVDRGEDPDQFRAGTIFVGEWSAQAAGDYCTGSNHVLPTGGAARFRGGLSAADFVRVFTVQRLTRAGLTAIGPAVVALAEAEGLQAHADSIRRRGC